MKIVEKLKHAEQHISSIVDHDDAELAYVEHAVSHLKKFLDDALAKAKQRRERKWQAEVAVKAKE
jgi:hypothetical protein